MPNKPAKCQAEWVLSGVVCDKPTAFYFRLASLYLPGFLIQPPTGPRFAGFPTIDACEDHADKIERRLKASGHDPIQRTP